MLEPLRQARIKTTGTVYLQPVAESERHMVEADIADVLRVLPAARLENLPIH